MHLFQSELGIVTMAQQISYRSWLILGLVVVVLGASVWFFNREKESPKLGSPDLIDLDLGVSPFASGDSRTPYWKEFTTVRGLQK